MCNDRPMTPDEKAVYIAAFIDGEGCVSCYRNVYQKSNNTRNTVRGISFANTERVLIDLMRQFLSDLGFKTSEWADKRNVKRRTCWSVSITGGRPAFERFAVMIPIQHPAKKAALDDLLKSYLDADTVRANRRACGKKHMAKILERRASRIIEGKFVTNTRNCD